MQKKPDITIANMRLAEVLAPNQVGTWGLVVDRDRAMVAALAGDDKNVYGTLMHRLTGLHQDMWSTLSAVRR